MHGNFNLLVLDEYSDFERCLGVIPKIAFLVGCHHLVYYLVRHWLEQRPLWWSVELLDCGHAFVVDLIVVSLHFVCTLDLHWHARARALAHSLHPRCNAPIELREHDNFLVLQVAHRC